MPNEIDSLEVSIESDASKANSEVDSLISKLRDLSSVISKIRGDKAFESMRDGAEEIAGEFKKAAKPVAEVKTDIKKLVSEISKKSIDIKPEVDTSNAEAETKKWQNQLRSAQNALNRILASSDPEKQAKGIERYTIRINEAKNALEQLKSVSMKPAESDMSHIDAAIKRMYDRKNAESRPNKEWENGRVEPLGSMKYDGAPIPDFLKSNDIKEATEELSDFEKTLESVQALEFKGNGFFEMEKWVSDLQSKLEQLLNKQEKLQDLGANVDTQRLQSIAYDIEQISKTLDVYEGKVESARKAGQLDIKVPKIDADVKDSDIKSVREKITSALSGAKIVIPTDGMNEIQKELDKVKRKYDDIAKSMSVKSSITPFYGATVDFKKKQAELAALRQEYQDLINKQKELSLSGGFQLNFKGLSDGAKTLGKNITPVASALSKANKHLSSFTRKVASTLAPTKKLKSAMGGLDLSSAGLAKSLLRTSKMLKLMVVRMALRGVIDGVKQGMVGLSQYSNETNKSLSLLMSSLKQLSASFAAAVSPIINAFAPALDFIIQKIIAVVNMINQLFSALTGKNTFIYAKKQADDFATAVGGANKNTKKLNQTLLGIDELNINNPDKNSGGSSGSGITGSDFEEKPIENKYKDLADKIKDFFSKLFAPLKEAWDREGQFVMDSWKYALDEVKKLVQDIGRDFLIMWNQEETIAMLADILHIIGDIGLVVGNLAKNFREAWNANDAGLRTLENIRDIFAVIIYNIRQAADATVEWSAGLNFKPLMEMIAQYTQSLIPVFDALSGVMTDFYTQVLLPLGKWTIENGLPELLNILKQFNESIDWSAMRQELSDLWLHLEPFAETVGQGLLDFIRDLSEKISSFANSEVFLSVLDEIKKWLNSVKPEGVTNALKDLAKALVAFKVAAVAVDIALKGTMIVQTLTKIGAAFESLRLFVQNFIAFFTGIPWLAIFQSMNPAMQAELFFRLEDKIAGTFLDPFSWDNVIGDLLRGIGNALGLLADGIIELLSEPLEVGKRAIESIFDISWVQELFEKCLENFRSAFKGEEIGKNIAEGFFNGISAAFGLLLAPIVNIFSDIVEAVCELLGIHSPSTVFAEIGENVISGLLLGISEFWNTIVEFFTNSFAELIAFFSNSWLSIQEGVTNVWNNITSFLTKTWTNISTTASAIWNAIKLFLITTWTNIKTTAIEIWTTIKDKIVEIWNKVKEKAEEIWDKVKEVVKEKFDKIKEKSDELIEKFRNLKEEVKEKFESVKEIINNTIGSAIDKLAGFIDKLREAGQAVKDFLESGYEKVSGIIGSIGGALGISAHSDDAASNPVAFSIPAYAVGGFPEDGLFYANHNELVGSFGNGKTAVANNDQIIEGIRSGVESAVENVLAPYLEQIVQNTRETAEKESSISIDGRELITAIDARSKRNGYSFT
jgi:phage-related protein